MRRPASFLPLCALVSLLAACAGSPPQGRTPYQPSPAMMSVLEERQAMRAQEPASLPIGQAREVPTLIDAARAIENVKGLPAPSTEVPQVRQLVASGAAGALSARLYRPALAKDTPVILYFVGGTWATGSLDTYEESARQLSARTGWVVVSLRTRLAPEATFPAAHDDAFALYQWARAHMREWGADPTRVALAGEGAGADLALSTALQARDRATAGQPVAVPDHLVLITPVTGTALNTVSMRESGRSNPLSRRTVDWAQWLYARDHLDDPRIDILARNDFQQMPPTTFVLAEIDPLRSGGEMLAAKFAAAGIPTEGRVFPGTTHDFFGLGQQVPEAAAAEDYVAARLRAAFYRPPMPVIAGPVRTQRPARHRRKP